MRLPRPSTATRQARRAIGLALVAAIAATASLAASAEAATFTVTNNHDEGPGSLRQAIADANAAPGAHTINFAAGVSGRIENVFEPLRITGNVVIHGPGADVLSISGRSVLRGITVASGATVTISGLSVIECAVAFRDADTVGGGIRNDGTLTVLDSRIVGNTVDGSAGGPGTGGGIYSTGTLTLRNTTVSGNSAAGGDVDGGGSGGGIFSSGTLTLTDSVVNENVATGGGLHGDDGGAGGGGIFSRGALTITGSSVSGNRFTAGNFRSSAVDGGGGIFSRGRLVMVDSRASDNQALGSGRGSTIQGGGILGQGTMSLSDATVAGNLAQATDGNPIGEGANGGGIYSGGTLAVQGSTVRDNAAVGARGGGRTGSPGNGGGIYNASTGTIVSSTVSANKALNGGLVGADGGGVYNSGNATLTNSTLSGNQAAGSLEAGYGGAGGGLANDSGSRAALTSVTMARNDALRGANLFSQAPATVQNTIISNAGSREDNCEVVALTSLGFNLEDANTCGLAKPTDIVRKDPQLAPLADNGGPTRTHAIPRSSAALDKGSSAGLTTDQRGLTRPVIWPGISRPPGGDGSDIGAYELQGSPGAGERLVGSVDPKRATVRVRTCFRFRVELGSGDPVRGARVKFLGERERTDARGRTTICERPRHRGTRRARFSKPGLEPDETYVRIVRG